MVYRFDGSAEAADRMTSAHVNHAMAGVAVWL